MPRFPHRPEDQYFLVFKGLTMTTSLKSIETSTILEVKALCSRTLILFLKYKKWCYVVLWFAMSDYPFKEMLWHSFKKHENTIKAKLTLKTINFDTQFGFLSLLWPWYPDERHQFGIQCLNISMGNISNCFKVKFSMRNELYACDLF